MQETKQGILIIIGGAEDKADCTILRKTTELAGGTDGKILS